MSGPSPDTLSQLDRPAARVGTLSSLMNIALWGSRVNKHFENREWPTYFKLSHHAILAVVPVPRHLYIRFVASTQAIRARLVHPMVLTQCSARAHISYGLVSASRVALEYLAANSLVIALPVLLSLAFELTQITQQSSQ